MGNCLKTQLKEVVQNDNLEVFGKAEFIIPANLNDVTVICGAAKGLTFKWSEGVTVRPYNDTTPYTSPYTFGDIISNFEIKVSSGSNGGTLSIENKYDMINNGGSLMLPNIAGMSNNASIDSIFYWYDSVMISFSGAFGYSGDISSISRLKNKNVVTLFRTTNGNFTGNISNLSLLPNVSTINLETTAITGEVESLITLTKLTALYLAHTNVTGSLNTLIEALAPSKAAGSTLTVSTAGTDIKYNNSVVPNQAVVTFDGNGGVSNVAIS